jgi:galactonate dehydratase
MTLALDVHTLPDPDGHGEALALKGDWLVVAISDGRYVGLGEASHSTDDAACRDRVNELFNRHITGSSPSLETIRELHRGPFSGASDRVAATAISALDQALHDLVARREGVPVWNLFEPSPSRTSVPVYLTLNRALAARDEAGYRKAVDRVLAMGVRCVKIAPFEAVTPGSVQLSTGQRGLELISSLRDRYPDLSIRVDFHERFTPENALALLPALDALDLEWIEVPCPIGPANAEIRALTAIPLAAGEFFFGSDAFVALGRRGWADVIMPDVKHCGGFGPLVEICGAVSPYAVEVSPHNPSGDVSTLATLHAACLAPNATSIELPLHGAGHAPAYLGLLDGGELRLPDGPGWGLGADDLLDSTKKGIAP